MLSHRENFKIGVLKTCADRGLTFEETHEVVKTAIARLNGTPEKAASVSGVLQSILKPVGDVASWGAKTLGTAALLAPIGIGAAGGYLAGRSSGELSDEDIKEVKKRELIGTYNRVADEARRKSQVSAQKRLRRSTPVRSLV